MGIFNQIELRERPREKLTAAGAESLSDGELLAVLLGSGNRYADVLTLSQAVLPTIDRLGESLSVIDLQELPGIGQAKAALVVAALEFARRRIRPSGTRVRHAADVYALVRHLCDRKQETFAAVTLNGAHEVIATRVITIGLLNRTQVHPREVFAEAITDRAAAIVVAHNHPSGVLTPSDEDITVTNRLVEAGKILGIGVLDHLIFSYTGFYSLKEEGRM